MARARTAAVALAILVYFALVAAYALTRAPYVDEAWFSMPAWNLARNGSMGTPVIEPSASPLPGLNVSLQGIRAHTYWNLPLPIVVEAAWYKLAGFSLFTTRLFTMVWAAVLLGAWFRLLRRFGGSAGFAALGVLLIATDQIFMTRAGLGRFDMMSAALGFAGIAAYLELRERSLGAALLAGNALVAAAGLTHPTGGLVSFPALVWLAVSLDRQRLRPWPHLALAAVPYAAGALGMAGYILQDPSSFRAQFFGITGGRLGGIRSPLMLVPRETRRYLDAYGLDTGGSILSRLKLLVLAAYVAAAGVVCASRQARRQYRVLLLLAGIYLACLTLFDNFKQQWYVLYMIPMFAALVAAAASVAGAGLWRSMVRLALVALIAFQVGSVVRLIAKNSYRNDYLPVIQFLKTHAGPGQLVMASSEWGFDYGFGGNLDDDIRLGYRSGRRPDFVIVDDRYRTAFQYFRTAEPETYRYVMGYLDAECHPVAMTPGHTVYARRGLD